MFLDARELESGRVLEADLCIVGAGAAGVTLAREFDQGLRSVILVESGGLEYDDDIQRLYIGEEHGTLIGSDSYYLTSSRFRYFGGSTNFWHGWSRPLDPEDFAVREWLEGSGWPLALADIEPFYQRAADVLEISPFDYDPHQVEAPIRRFLFEPGAGFETIFFHISPTNFGARYRGELGESERVRVVLNGSATRILVNEEASRAEALEVATLGGTRFKVRARAYALAAGGIENPRLLLVSNQVQEEGLGNRHDLVGRYFMDHPNMRTGHLVAFNPARTLRFHVPFELGDRGHKARAVLRTTWELQREHRLLNSLVVVEPQPATQLPDLTPAVAQLTRDLVPLAGEDKEFREGRVDYASFRVVGEPSPNPASRVSLSGERDALGVPTVRLDWRLTDQDAASLHRVAELLAVELGARLRGRAHLSLSEEEPWRETGWSSHHMGTTRMDPDPRRGVVDADGRVHGVDNLYVAGSSVFPTAGCSNSTFMIVALTLRLGDHLKQVLAR